MSTRRCWQWLYPTWKSKASTSLSGGCLAAAQTNCESLAAWLLEREVEEAVMESTAQYWKPVWEALERYWKPLRQKREGASRRSETLHLAQAQSNRGRRQREMAGDIVMPRASRSEPNDGGDLAGRKPYTDDAARRLPPATRRQIPDEISRQTGRRVFPLYHSVTAPP